MLFVDYSVIVDVLTTV